METRLQRLSDIERKELKLLMEKLKEKNSSNMDIAFKKFGKLIHKADSFDPIDDEDEELEILFDLFEKVWPEGANLRKSGDLLKLGEKIKCPVAAIHGDYDTHMAEGVEKPLAKVLKDFKFILLAKCGHTPWQEKQAREKFLQVLKSEL